MVRRMPLLLVRGEAGIPAHRGWAGDCRLVAALPHENCARISRALFFRGMGSIRHLGRPRLRVAGPEVERRMIQPASATTTVRSACK